MGGWKELSGKLEPAQYLARQDHKQKLQNNGTRTNVGKYSFLNRTSRDWNALPEEAFEDEFTEFYSRCLLCACKPVVSPSTHVPILAEAGKQQHLAEKIKKYINLQIEAELPQNVCHSCMEKLEVTHELVTSSRRARIILLQIRQQIENCIKETNQLNCSALELDSYQPATDSAAIHIEMDTNMIEIPLVNSNYSAEDFNAEIVVEFVEEPNTDPDSTIGQADPSEEELHGSRDDMETSEQNIMESPLLCFQDDPTVHEEAKHEELKTDQQYDKGTVGREEDTSTEALHEVESDQNFVESPQISFEADRTVHEEAEHEGLNSDQQYDEGTLEMEEEAGTGLLTLDLEKTNEEPETHSIPSQVMENQKHKQHFGEAVQCEICDKILKHKYCLVKHKNEKHYMSLSFDCEACEKKYPSLQSIMQHIRLTHSTKKCGESSAKRGRKICHKQPPSNGNFVMQDIKHITLTKKRGKSPRKRGHNQHSRKGNFIMQDIKHINLTKKHGKSPRKRGRKPRSSKRNLDRVHCDICGHSSKSKHLLVNHINDRHLDFVVEPLRFYCNKCDKDYSSNQNLLKHQRKVHMLKIECGQCGKMIRKYRISKHCKLHHSVGEASSKEKLDSPQPATDSAAIHNGNTVNNTKKEIPMDSTEKFDLSGNNPVFQLDEDEPTPTSTPESELNQTMLDAGEPANHSETDTIPATKTIKHIAPSWRQHAVYCILCGHPAKNKNSLVKHINAKHLDLVEDPFTFRCEGCNQSFSDYKALAMHQSVHVPRLKCDHCDQTINMNCMSSHMKSHSPSTASRAPEGTEDQADFVAEVDEIEIEEHLNEALEEQMDQEIENNAMDGTEENTVTIGEVFTPEIAFQIAFEIAESELKHDPDEEQIHQNAENEAPKGTELERDFADGVLISKIEIEDHPIDPEPVDQETGATPVPANLECELKLHKLLVCECCSFYTENKNEFATHMQVHGSPNTSAGLIDYQKDPANDARKLENCQISTINEDTIEDNGKESSRKMKNGVSKSKKHLKQFVSNFQGTKTGYKCLHCEETFYYFSHLQSHCNDKHPKKNILQCDICKAEFISRYGYMYHKKHKHEGQKFTCTFCNNIFRYPTNLGWHIKSMHLNPKKEFSCKICNKKFNFQTYLHRHVYYSHTGTILHCEFCKYITRSKSHLIRHLKCKHLQVKKLSCKFCPATFTCNGSYA